MSTQHLSSFIRTESLWCFCQKAEDRIYGSDDCIYWGENDGGLADTLGN